MAKFSFCIFTMAVLLGGTAADLMCILHETMAITPDHFITNQEKACRGLDTKFEKARQELKKCLDIEVDLDKLEALHLEFCNPRSQFRRKVDRQRHCITRSLPQSLDCLSSMDNSKHLDHDNILRKSVYEICRSLSVEMSKCLADKVGGPCGAEGREVYGRMTEASEPFFTLSCYSVAKLAAGDSNLLEEIEEAEQKELEASLSQDYDQYMTAAATTHSAIIWCILVGLFLATRWW